MDEKLKNILLKIQLLCKQNPVFEKEIKNLFSIKSSKTDNITHDIASIREALGIRADNSIDFGFVEDEFVRNQLIVDNLRMEDSALDLIKTEEIRFYEFCVNAFYQIENIINFFWVKKFKDVKSISTMVEQSTVNEWSKDKTTNYGYKPTGKETHVSDIPISSKLNAFCNLFIGDRNFKIALSNLRQVRNKGAHRCNIDREINIKERDTFHDFYQKNTYDNVRNLVRRVVDTVQCELEKEYPSERIPNITLNMNIKL